MRTPASDSVTRSPEGDVGGVSAGVEIDVKAGSSSRRAMTHAASAVTARGLALAGAAPANFLRHNPKSADSKAWCATEAPSANAAGPPRFHHLPPACLALAGATCHSHSKLAQSHRRPSCHSNHYDGKTFALCIREFKTGCADGYPSRVFPRPAARNALRTQRSDTS
ncbi:unnamed protein product [Candidatus Paraburkholderia kirkii UZHbot1]|uniref:WGS project CAFE00000000 data, contig bkir_c131 n=1 Tax=Candidatus Paraburkholderia kirkii UZHbot1 TaxID=1055526 RepID=U3UAF7_9BURK|nr:unnamed protein product [Candidatus Paraburkholderia kirkii UZHbot1]